ncbi:hypothetical protein F4780DRAFT_773223 [Xylariomycetidae sp. FL0641]|nr:hypothetical protein F4780DRAFT_773223 [Xylariomycetidae sp. FL0641]
MDPIPRWDRTLSVQSKLRYLGCDLLNGCCTEAIRAGDMGRKLQGLCKTLPDRFHAHLNVVIDEIRSTHTLLRDLADLSQVHVSRIPSIINHLNVILLCLSRTLVDMNEIYEDKSETRERRWRKMYHALSNELPGTNLPARFMLYNQFLQQLQLLVKKDPNYDINATASLQIRILQLREARNIPPPSPLRLDLGGHDTALSLWPNEPDSHWAEAIFTRSLPSRRGFRKLHSSAAYGDLRRLGLHPIPSDTATLVKRSFDDGEFSVVIFLQQEDQTPYLMVRTYHQGEPWVQIRGAHELCIHRERGSRLEFSRWSFSRQEARPWASLCFLTWEELVLFYCTFVCLKTHSERTTSLRPREYEIRQERCLFRAKIEDDKYDHMLSVYEDRITKGRRLQAAAWGGELHECPVWTAFLPLEPADDWLVKKSRKRIWLRNIQIYTFNHDYRERHQRKGRLAAFELSFDKKEDATHFKELFITPEPSIAEALPSAPASPESTPPEPMPPEPMPPEPMPPRPTVVSAEENDDEEEEDNNDD